jgi:hypothetical protein
METRLAVFFSAFSFYLLNSPRLDSHVRWVVLVHARRSPPETSVPHGRGPQGEHEDATQMNERMGRSRIFGVQRSTRFSSRYSGVPGINWHVGRIFTYFCLSDLNYSNPLIISSDTIGKTLESFNGIGGVIVILRVELCCVFAVILVASSLKTVPTCGRVC